jgi:hypothetical protein
MGRRMEHVCGHGSRGRGPPGRFNPLSPFGILLCCFSGLLIAPFMRAQQKEVLQRNGQ